MAVLAFHCTLVHQAEGGQSHTLMWEVESPEGDHHIHDPHQGVGSFVSEGEEDHACLVRLEAEEDHLVPEDQGQVRSLSGLIDQVLALVRGPVKKLGVDDRLDPVPHQE